MVVMCVMLCGRWGAEAPREIPCSLWAAVLGGLGMWGPGRPRNTPPQTAQSPQMKPSSTLYLTTYI
jgi:hypothetical protein